MLRDRESNSEQKGYDSFQFPELLSTSQYRENNERDTGIEPVFVTWQATVIPLYESRLVSTLQVTKPFYDRK